MTVAAFAALSCLLLVVSLPQLMVAWLTAPLGLDHTHQTVLTVDQQKKYLDALGILPQWQIYYALSEATLQRPNLTTLERESAITMLQQAASLAPGNTHIWYMLAAALEPEMFNAERRELWDRAMSMSILTGPFARDLTTPRAQQMIAHWDIASQDLKNLWQDQMVSLWGAAPNDMYRLYQSLPAAGQQIIVDTLGEVPEWEENNWKNY